MRMLVENVLGSQKNRQRIIPCIGIRCENDAVEHDSRIRLTVSNFLMKSKLYSTFYLILLFWVLYDYTISLAISFMHRHPEKSGVPVALMGKGGSVWHWGVRRHTGEPEDGLPVLGALHVRDSGRRVGGDRRRLSSKQWPVCLSWNIQTMVGVSTIRTVLRNHIKNCNEAHSSWNLTKLLCFFNPNGRNCWNNYEVTGVFYTEKFIAKLEPIGEKLKTDTFWLTMKYQN